MRKTLPAAPENIIFGFGFVPSGTLSETLKHHVQELCSELTPLGDTYTVLVEKKKHRAVT